MITWDMVLAAISENLPDYEKLETKIQDGVNLFGAAQFGQLSLEYLFEEKYKIQCFFDSSPEKRNRVIHGIPVMGGG